MTAKPLVFVSHAASDASVAKVFKANMERHFLGLCDIFVSSNLDSLQAGEEWSASIKAALSRAAILVGLLSPAALERPWVYFEFGGAWMREIPAIPVCHSGLRREGLPVPISQFQGLDLDDQEHLRGLYRRIAAVLGCTVPDIEFEKLASDYRDLTETKRRAEVVDKWLVELIKWNPHLRQLFSGEKTEIDDVHVPHSLEMPFKEFINVAQESKFLIISGAGMGIGTRVGAMASIFRFEKGENFETLAERIA